MKSRKIKIAVIVLACLVLLGSGLLIRNDLKEPSQKELLKENSIYTGKGIKIAIIDSGIEKAYEEQIVRNVNFTDSKNSYDENGHGTFMFQMIHSSKIGSAPDAEIYILKVTDEKCQGITESMVEAIKWCVEHKIQFISMSLSTSKDHAILHNAIKEADKKGVRVIASVANDSCFRSYPASYDEVIGVYAWREKEEYEKFDYLYCPVNFFVLDERGKDSIVGNSPATAFVCGLAAQVYEENECSELSLRELKDLLVAKLRL